MQARGTSGIEHLFRNRTYRKEVVHGGSALVKAYLGQSGEPVPTHSIVPLLANTSA